MEAHCQALFQLLLLSFQLSFTKSQSDVRTGVVPIFSPRSTNQPITFTFTTPSPHKRVVTEFPVHVEASKFPTLRPDPSLAVPWESNGPVGSISPIIEVPSIDLSMPIYNQAQYFRALQKAGASNSASQELVNLSVPKVISIPSVQSVPVQKIVPVSPKMISTNTAAQNLQYESFWQDVDTAWGRAKVRLSETGAMSDWRRLWEKLTGQQIPSYTNEPLVGDRLPTQEMKTLHRFFFQ